jgi:hypothetical protein
MATAAVSTNSAAQSPAMGMGFAKVKLDQMSMSERAQLETKLSQDNFSIKKAGAGKYEITADDSILQISVKPEQREQVKSLIDEVTKERVDWTRNYCASKLLKQLANIDGVTIKLGTPYVLAADRTPSYTELDKTASALLGKDITLDHRSLIAGRTVIAVDGKKFEVNMPAPRAAEDAFRVALDNHLRSYEKKMQGATPDEKTKLMNERALNLTRLMCNFTHEGVALPIRLNEAALSKVEGTPGLKFDLPKSLSEALEISAQHLLSAPQREIKVSASLDEKSNCYAMSIENNKSRLVVDIDAGLLKRLKPEGRLSFLQKLATEVKKKASSLLNDEAGVTTLAAFIQEKLANIPASRQMAAPVAKFACADTNASFDLRTGKPVEKVQARRGSFQEFERRLKEEDETAAQQKAAVQIVDPEVLPAEPAAKPAASPANAPQGPVIDVDATTSNRTTPPPLPTDVKPERDPSVPPPLPGQQAATAQPPPLPQAAEPQSSLSNFFKKARSLFSGALARSRSLFSNYDAPAPQV